MYSSSSSQICFDTNIIVFAQVPISTRTAVSNELWYHVWYAVETPSWNMTRTPTASTIDVALENILKEL